MINLEEIIRQYPAELRKKEFYELMVKEYIHHHMLRSLFTGKYAMKISFMGGNALRYFYGIKRFSEDLDFDCSDLNKDQFLDMTSQVQRDLLQFNFQVVIEDKTKDDNLKAFRRTFVFPELKYQLGISQQRDAKFYIKIETQPQNFNYTADVRTLNGFEITTAIRLVPLEIMFSSKILAALTRKKDRDFYDFIFLSGFSKPDFNYLKQKADISNIIQLKSALLQAAIQKNMLKRIHFDCDHMLFNKNDNSKIREINEYLNSFDFEKFR
jgi:predicted nucleotidyltransferase component of viral defense system